jgi:hypothetical protein
VYTNGIGALTLHQSNHIRASPMGRWMSHINGKLARLGENCAPIVSTCDSPSFALRHFLCLTRYLAARWCALNFPQQSQVNRHEIGYKCVRGDGGCDRGGEKDVKGKEFHCRGGQVALVAKSGTPDLGFG